MTQDLPISPWLDTIGETLLSSPSRFLVLTAETAAGKSTAVPQSLLSRVPGKIIMLEPRRIAAVAIANRIASLLGESPGETAGYRLHLESKVSARTRIEIITEAILTRRMQTDPALDGVSVVIIDEFHERSIHADLALALLREVALLRNDIYVIVMSATIDTERIASWLGCPVLRIPGRQWPVSIRYFPPAAVPRGRNGPSLEERTASAVRQALAGEEGGILAFLPGLAEIRRTQALLEGCGAEVLPLHSSVSFEEQKRVLEENRDGRRVILSSSIAETSLTVPGVRVVIDSGLSRISRYHVPTGMSRLVTEVESVFSAAQRAGRAGRTGPGTCIRLWAEHDVRVPETPPEILRADLVPLVLDCALWGVSSVGGISWLDAPAQGSWETAAALLHDMEAIDAAGRVTGRGRKMAALGVHPRIAAVALSGETELAVRYSGYSGSPRELARFRADLERRLAGCGKPEGCPDNPVIALLSGFPDRIARHRGDGVYQFPSGRLASLPPGIRMNTARASEWIVAPEVDAGEREGRIYSFEPLDADSALDWLSARSTKTVELSFPDGEYSPGSRLRKTEKETYGRILLAERPVPVGPADITGALCAAFRKKGLDALLWSAVSRDFLCRARFRFRRLNDGNGNSPSGEDLLANLEAWLVPFLPADGRLQEDTVLDALRWYLDGPAVDRDVPTRLRLPNGSNRPLLYEELEPGSGPVPVLEIRVQDLFGCTVTPEVLREPVLLRILSPARRPVQITRDLPGFWKNTWPEVRKELKGRYPKHRWPEDPLAAAPPERPPVR